jgi:hypothetical protein
MFLCSFFLKRALTFKTVFSADGGFDRAKMKSWDRSFYFLYAYIIVVVAAYEISAYYCSWDLFWPNLFQFLVNVTYTGL